MSDPIVTDEFVAWYDGLTLQDQKAVQFVVNLLAEKGTTLGFPHSSAIATSKHALRELRAQVGGRPLRVFYAFDPRRDAVVLVGGDKTGDDRFYERMVPLAERIWEDYLGGG